ncbi:membrane protein [Pontibacillus halophilus JSM 076056 = DSM 19796]|uniref:Membrane protein n=1 Tax=Pontibacillus halophilus JSM 076056 = DSM 19796 TaxID=1385510 RepID=A0A0A5GJ19_9BACI|nr:DMT family transporter [Pontibacillus halophilus]KGX91140.1 membrane protein [Pontibacillus halophilus JSM 076056 = DSM 19796]
MGTFMIIFTLLGGVALSAQSSINGALSKRAGTFETAFLTFMTGAMFLTLIVLFFGEGNVLLVFEAPKWQLTSAILGVSFMFLTVLSVPKIGVAATNLTAISGQLLASMVIDHMGWFGNKVVLFDAERIIGIVLMFIALYLLFKGDKKTIQH